MSKRITRSMGAAIDTFWGKAMQHTDTTPYFIEPGDDQGECLGEPLCIVRERGEDDRRVFARIRKILATALAESEGKD